jgi:hypothetical protein
MRIFILHVLIRFNVKYYFRAKSLVIEWLVLNNATLLFYMRSIRVTYN